MRGSAVTGKIERNQIVPLQQGREPIKRPGVVEPAMQGQYRRIGGITPGFRRQGQMPQRDAQLVYPIVTHEPVSR